MTLKQENTCMDRLSRALLALRFREEGQTVVEYALIFVLVTLVVITLLSVIGAAPGRVFSNINADF
jgi:Flp pilus assembly pilin Flp